MKERRKKINVKKSENKNPSGNSYGLFGGRKREKNEKQESREKSSLLITHHSL